MDSQSHVTGRKPNPFRRPLHSFSLRTLLLLVVAIGVPLGWFSAKIKRARYQRSLVESIRKAGGRVTYGGDSPQWAVGLLGIDLLAEVNYVDFRQVRVSDATIGQIAQLPALLTLYLDECEFTRAALLKLATSRPMARLAVRLPDTTDDAIAELLAGTDVRCLEIGGSRLTDAAFVHLIRLRNLQRLEIFDAGITDAGADQLAAMPLLGVVTLRATSVTRQCAERLQTALPKCDVEVAP